MYRERLRVFDRKEDAKAISVPTARHRKPVKQDDHTSDHPRALTVHAESDAESDMSRWAKSDAQSERSSSTESDFQSFGFLPR